MEISVIIPTYNRSDTIREVLEHLSSQSLDKNDYEIIIVDDGSTDSTDKIVKKFIQENKDLNIKFFKQKNSGPAKARNAGIKNSIGRILVIIGDDIICPRDFLKNHIKAHKTKNIAVTGDQIWTKKPNEFMKLLVDNESATKRKNNLGIGGFCTANVSIERKWLQQELFDEDMGFGFEDSELGYRLMKKGVRMVFDSSTKVYHKHYYDLEAFRKRQKTSGKNVPLFVKKHPELKSTIVPKNRKIKKTLCMLLIKLGIFQRLSPPFYAKLEDLVNRIDGIEQGIKQYGIKI